MTNAAGILKAYRRKFGGQPFDFLHMDRKAGAEAIEIMTRALESGKPVSEADKDRLSPIKYDGKTFVM